MNILVLLVLIFVSPFVMAQEESLAFITQIRDLVIGGGASYTKVKLYRQDGTDHEENEKWIHVASNVTDINGRITNLVTPLQFPIGFYKIIFQTRKYYAAKNMETLYPYLEILFNKSTPDQILLVVNVSPYGYSAYKGVNGIK